MHYEDRQSTEFKLSLEDKKRLKAYCKSIMEPQSLVVRRIVLNFLNEVSSEKGEV